MHMAQTSGYRERNSTADRALTLLAMFTEAQPELSATEVAESLGVARSTAYRYLETLVQSGFLAETGRGAFRLGARILELARIARAGFGLSDVCVPAMRELAAECHQTVLLTKRVGNSIVCLEREESSEQYVRLSYERGTVLSPNAGASALALLAWMPEPEVRKLLAAAPLPQFNPNTMTDPDEIVHRLGEIKDQGFAVSIGEVDPTAQGIAAPIFGRHGDVVAGLSVVLIRTFVEPAQIGVITQRVVAVAEELSRQVRLYEV